MLTKKPSEAKDRIILALDVDDINEAEKLVSELKDYVGFFKVGLQVYTSCGSEIVDMIHSYGSKVFFDGKFHDIPNTVAKASVNLVKKGVDVFDVLQNNDAFHALEKFGGLIVTGPTGTNVNDVAVALLG